jgi:sterol desaturase/sphingolipid hydroxylase (fatty acid hydroxylase superfamily)
MARGTTVASLLIILAGLAICVYPLASGYSQSLPLLDNVWGMGHSLMLICGGVLVALGVGLEYRAEQVELTRITRADKKRRKDASVKRPEIRDAFITGWALGTMILVSLGVVFFYAEMSAQFEGIRPAHTLLFGFYLGAVIAMPLGLYFAKLALHQKSAPRWSR